MPDNSAANELIGKRYLTLVLRLLVDNQGRLQQGTLIDLNEEAIGQFRQLNDLPPLIKQWLEARKHKPNAPTPD